MVWRFPLHADVVLDLLQDLFDTELVWVGSWEAPDEGVDYIAQVIVTDDGYNTIDETRWGSVEIAVEAEKRSDAKLLAVEISSALNDLPGKVVRNVLVDDVAENQGPRSVGDIDRSVRSYQMVYSLAFRKQFFEGE